MNTEFKPMRAENMNWEEVRVNAAIAAMRGILVNALRELAIARLAVEQADELVNESRSHSAPTTDEH